MYLDSHCFVIRDIAPIAPVHLLVVPLKHITSLQKVDGKQQALLGHLFTVAKQMAYQEQVSKSGYRLVINQGNDAGQQIDHLHLHVLAGKSLSGMG
jgi:histidine triad (HIT) family protein